MAKVNRFDYVEFDSDSKKTQETALEAVCGLEVIINGIASPRAKALALTKLEEVYMWIGKGIRDDQLTRTGGQ